MSNDPKRQGPKDEQQKTQQDTPNFEDLTVAEPEVEVLSNEDARAIPEGGASFAPDGAFSCTITSSSM